jgi:hypothetical protein
MPHPSLVAHNYPPLAHNEFCGVTKAVRASSERLAPPQVAVHCPLSTERCTPTPPPIFIFDPVFLQIIITILKSILSEDILRKTHPSAFADNYRLRATFATQVGIASSENDLLRIKRG